MKAQRLVVGLLLTLLSSTACAPEDNTESASSDLATTRGITVTASWRPVLTGTPTYGFYPTEPRARFGLSVDDAKVRAQSAGFDGLERAFVLVPRETGGEPSWERIDLSWTGTGTEGYIATRQIDRYEASNVRLSERDVELAETLGVAAGIETNVGTIWAQDPGDNVRVRREE